MLLTKEQRKNFARFIIAIGATMVFVLAMQNINQIQTTIASGLGNPYAGIAIIGLSGGTVFVAIDTYKKRKNRKGSLIFGAGGPGKGILTETKIDFEPAIAKYAENAVDTLIINPTETNAKIVESKPYATKIPPNIDAVILDVPAGLGSMKAARVLYRTLKPFYDKARKKLEDHYVSAIGILGPGITGPISVEMFKLDSNPSAKFRGFFYVCDPDAAPEETAKEDTLQINHVQIPQKILKSTVRRNDIERTKPALELLKPKRLEQEKYEWQVEFAHECSRRMIPIIISENISGHDNVRKKAIVLLTAIAGSASNHNNGIFEGEQKFADAEISKWATRYPGVYTHSENYVELNTRHDINTLLTDLVMFREKRIEVAFSAFDYNYPLQLRDPPILIGVGHSDLLQQASEAVMEATGHSDALIIANSINGASSALIALFFPLTEDELQDSSSCKSIGEGWVKGINKEVISCV